MIISYKRTYTVFSLLVALVMLASLALPVQAQDPQPPLEQPTEQPALETATEATPEPAADPALDTSAGDAQPPTTPDAQALGNSFSGRLLLLWGDGYPGADGQAASLFIVSLILEDGTRVPFQFGDTMPFTFEQLRTLTGRLVTVSGDWSADAPGQFVPATLELSADDTGGDLNAQAVTGSKPYISIMCKFKDVATEGQNQSYFQNMYANTWPGLDTFWREISYNNINILGSGAFGWFTLPQNRSYYVTASGLDWGRAADDCTALADPEVDFNDYNGINLMFNDVLDCCAWGGSEWMTLDGTTKAWPMTWEPPWGWENNTVIAHEMGHSIGFPHSAYNRSVVYDNFWDVMSGAWTGFYDTPNVYGELPQGTITYHLNLNGWIPTGRKITINPGSAQTITLDRLNQAPGSNYLMAVVPIAGSGTHYYTVEARFTSGYAAGTGFDRHLPGTAVIIHEITTSNGIPAQLKGSDGTTGAMWTVGETFTGTNNITITVNSVASASFNVTISNDAGSVSVPATPSNFRSTSASGSSIALAWDDVSSETGYRLYRWNGSTYALLQTLGANVVTATDSSLTCNSAYSYKLSAYNTNGESAQTAALDVSTGICTPDMPANFRITATTVSSISMAWDDVVTETGYTVYKWGFQDGVWDFYFLISLGANVTTFTENDLACNTTYYYQVAAYNSYGESVRAGWIQATTGACTSPPTPANFRVTSSGLTSIALAWDDVGNENGYRIYKWNGIAYLLLTANSANLTTFTDTNLTCGTAYSYKLSAFNTYGESALTPALDITMQACGPGPANDFIETPITIHVLPYSTSLDTTAATISSSDPDLTICNRVKGKTSVWYEYTPMSSGSIKVDTRGSDYDTMLAVWSGNPSSLALVACNDDIGNEGGVWNYASELIVSLTSATHYYIEVSEYNGSLTPLGNLSKPNTDVGAQSGGQMVLNVVSAVPPAVPTLLTPVNASLVTNYTPTLDWNGVTGAVTYRLQVATDSAFTSLVIDQTVTSFSFTPLTALAANTTFYWHVYATNVFNISSAWSITRYFRTKMTPPTLLDPLGGITTATKRPTFDWEDVSGVTNYTIQISTSNIFTTTTVNTSVTPSTYTRTTDFSAKTRYYWRVKANGTNPSDWSVVESFITPNPPSVPTPVSPASNTLLYTFTPKLDWSTSTVPSGTLFSHYRLQVATDLAFSSLVQDIDIYGAATNSVYTLVTPLAANLKYYWRVSAYDSLGYHSSWSSVWSIRIALPKPVLLSPANNASLAIRRPTFTWTEVTGATSYTIQISTSSTFSSYTVNTTVYGLTYTSATSLTRAKYYYWRVRANGTNPSAWTSAWKFYIQ
jgi:M6 family metalloprotease-like protein